MKKEDLKIHFCSRSILAISLSLVLGLIIILTLWFWKAPLRGHGGLPFFKRVEIAVPPFFQQDPRWSSEALGGTTDTLGSSGCAVTAASMVLAYYGVPIDPKNLNIYLTKNNGYEDSAWLKWEVAGTYPPNIAEKRYEDLPSYGLIDWNLLWGNPVIIRIRRPTAKTHFVVIVGKEGFDYLIRDPGPKGMQGIYPFYELQTPIEALRFYRKK